MVDVAEKIDSRIFNLLEDALVYRCYIATHRTTVLNWMKIPGIREAAIRDIAEGHGGEHTMRELSKYFTEV